MSEKRKETCTGCSACAAICPVGAITMEDSAEGFPLPQIDSNKCNNCGLCLKRCPQETTFCEFDFPEIYAYKHNSEEIRMHSTSGGAFTALSDEVLNNDGIVYGAVYEKNFDVHHIRADRSDTRNLMRGSKYVKSFVSAEIYKQIKTDLENDKLVLFSGTPCQVAGLKSFLNSDYSNLICVDLVCHGTPSHKLWLSYLADIEKKYAKQIEKVRFRSKETGWHASVLRIFNKKGAFPSHISEYWTNLFLKHFAHSPACFECKYCDYKRVSDITIADFWGIEKTMPQIDDDKGVSLVFVNTSKGKVFFERALANGEVYVSNADSCKQAHLMYPPQKPDGYEKFWEEYLRSGEALKTIKKYSELNRIKYYSKRIAKKTIKRLLKVNRRG